MELSLYTWNSIAINDGSVFRAVIPPGGMENFRTNPVSVPRANDYPYLSRTMLPVHTFSINVDVLPGNNIAAKREILKGYFNPRDQQRHNLIAKDTADSDRQWYLTGFLMAFAPINKITWSITFAVETPEWRLVTAGSNTWNITASGQTNAVTNIGNVNVAPSFAITPTTTKAGGLLYGSYVTLYNNLDVSWKEPYVLTVDTAALISDNSNKCQLNGAINNSVTTIPYDTVTGTIPSSGMGYIDSEQISWTGKTGTDLTGVTRGINGTSAASHLDNAVVYVSHLQADGGDVRLWYDGGFVDYWLSGINTAATKIHFNPDLSPRHEGTLKTALANANTDVTVEFNQTSANKAMLEWLARTTNRNFLIDSEIFYYEAANVDVVAYKITAVKRSQKGQGYAAHSANATIRHIEHDIWILYGDSTLAAYDANADNKPIFDLTSSNATRTYTNFYDTSAARPGAWRGSVETKTGLSYLFTGSENTQADPSTELGMSLTGSNSAYNMTSETGTVAWVLSHPAGFSFVTFTPEVYAVHSFPEVAGLQYLVENTAWFTAYSVGAPIANYSWEASGPNTVALSSPYPTSIRFVLDGSLAPATGEQALMQCDTVSVTVDSTKLPGATVGAEASINFFDFTLTNNTTTEYIKVKTPCPVNTALTVDCENKTAYLADGSRVAVTLSTNRDAWLDLRSGSNTLQFDDVGTVAVTVITQHRDRTL